MFKLVFIAVAITTVLSTPVDQKDSDKLNLHDVAANEISSSSIKLEEIADVNHNQEITKATVKPVHGADYTQDYTHTYVPTDDTFKPQPAGSTFARLIDDIFQIPISVLQSVSRLLTNPFKQQVHSPPDSQPTLAN